MVVAVVFSIIMEDEVEQRRINSKLLIAQDYEKIAEYLFYGIAVYPILIVVEDRWQHGSLIIREKVIQVMVPGSPKALIYEPYNSEIKIVMQEGLPDAPSFILELSNGSSYMCSTNGEPALQEMIIRTLEAFKIRAATPKIVWKKPRAGWLKLNTANIFVKRHSLAIGAVIRDDCGGWITGISGHIDGDSFNVADLVTLREGLKLALELGGNDMIEVETDYEIQCILLQEEEHEYQPLNPLLDECRTLLGDLSQFRLVQLMCGGNRAAEFLAKDGLKLKKMEVRRLYELPQDLSSILLEESN